MKIDRKLKIKVYVVTCLVIGVFMVAVASGCEI